MGYVRVYIPGARSSGPPRRRSYAGARRYPAGGRRRAGAPRPYNPYY